MKFNLKLLGLLVAVLVGAFVNFANLNVAFSDSESSLSRTVTLMNIALANGGDGESAHGSEKFNGREHRSSTRADGTLCYYQCLDESSESCTYFHNYMNDCNQ